MRDTTCNYDVALLPLIVIAFAFFAGRSSLAAQFEYVDLIPPCLEDKIALSGDSRNDHPADHWHTRYERAIFKVEIGTDYKFEGNATLISSDGYFLTAAHVALAGDPITIARPPRSDGDQEERIPVHVVFAGKPASTPAEG